METYRRVIPDALLDILCSDDIEVQQLGFIMLKLSATDLLSLSSVPNNRFIFKVLRFRLAERGRYLTTRSKNRRRAKTSATGLATIKRHVKDEKIKKERWEKKARLRSQNSRTTT